MEEVEEGKFAECVGAQDAIAQERLHIERVARVLARSSPQPHALDNAAIALSGGGIRSAAICMGFMQALAERRILSKFDYVSAVSGGGYALGWWSALVHHAAIEQAPAKNQPEANAAQVAAAVLAAEERVAANTFTAEDTTNLLQDARERQYVRSHGNYLTVRMGPMSVDTWTPIFMIGRNLFFGVVGIAGFAVAAAWVLLGTLRGLQGALEANRVFTAAALAVAAMLLSVGWSRTCLAVYSMSAARGNVKYWGSTIAALVVGAVAYAAVLSVPCKASPADKVLISGSLALLALADLIFVALLFHRARHKGGREAQGSGLSERLGEPFERDAIGRSQRLKGMAIAPFALALCSMVGAVLAGLFVGAPLKCDTAKVSELAIVAVFAEAPGHAFWIGLVLMQAWQLTRLYGVLWQGWETTSNRFRLDGDWASYLASAVFLVLFTAMLPYLVSSMSDMFGSANFWSRSGALALWIVVIACLGNALVSVVEGAQADSLHREFWARWSAQLVLGVAGVCVLLLLAGQAFRLVQKTDVLQLTPAAVKGSGMATAAMLALFLVALAASTNSRLKIVARFAGFSAVALFAVAIVLMAVAIGWTPFPNSDTQFALLSVLVLLVFASACASVVLENLGSRSSKFVSLLSAAGLVGGISTSVALAFQNGLMVSLLAVLSGLILFRSGPNTFSMHELYRNRLVRAFLGAANAHRTPVVPPDLDVSDDPPLSSLAVGKPGEKCAPRPFPIWGAAVNITVADQVGMQERRAASFSFSPLYCGLHVPAIEVARGEERAKYRSDRAYAPVESHGSQYERTSGEYEREDLTLGTVVATSGAAFSSNSGSSTTPERALLLTLLGFRLGRWFPNPAKCVKQDDKSRYTGPDNPWVAGIPLYISGDSLANVERWRKWTSPLIFREALSQCDITSEAVYVTDGGHFENLGVYEMIRRKLSTILCIDAGCDPKFGFSDLLNLQSKVRSDFGVEIELTNLSSMAIEPGEKWAQVCLREFPIVYSRNSRGEPDEVGRLIYCKSTLTGDEPLDVHDYRSRVASFPHVSTVNQWFAESAFEAYRTLGLHIGRKAGAHICRQYLWASA